MMYSQPLIRAILPVLFSLTFLRLLIFRYVDHCLLLDKLYSIGLNLNALLWFNSYVRNRMQRVTFQRAQSEYLLVEKGVPQESILRPFLFSLMTFLAPAQTEWFISMPMTLLFTSLIQIVI